MQCVLPTQAVPLAGAVVGQVLGQTFLVHSKTRFELHVHVLHPSPAGFTSPGVHGPLVSSAESPGVVSPLTVVSLVDESEVVPLLHAGSNAHAVESSTPPHARAQTKNEASAPIERNAKREREGRRLVIGPSASECSAAATLQPYGHH